MNLVFRENYWDYPDLKNEFMNFLIEIHKLDLTNWDKLGYWDRKYRPFSFFQGKTLVSGLCVYTMNMMVGGKQCLVAQISAAGTLPKFRRQGLNSELIKRAMSWAEANHDFFFLYANDDAYSFYKRCGFRKVDEHACCYQIKGMKAKAGSAKLDINNKKDLDIIYRIASEREPVSDLLGINNNKLLMFWCLYFLKENIYYIKEYDMLVLYKRKDGLLEIFDIVSSKVPPFAEIYPFIGEKNDKAVEFLFMADKMDLTNQAETRPIVENSLHLYGSFPFEDRKFIFPITAQA